MVLLAARRANDEDIKKLYEHLDKIEKALPSPESVIMGLEFHQIIADSTHNPVLSSVEKSLLKLFEDYAKRIFPETPSYKFDVESHRQIVECIAAHDVQGAYQMSVQDIRSFLNNTGLYSVKDPLENSR
jgi:DNA-binding FadR family transcriptional regulator